MRSRCVLIGSLATVLLVALATCSPVVAPFTIYRGATHVALDGGDMGPASGVILPGRPFINRYALLQHQLRGDQDDATRPQGYPSRFVDYLAPASQTSDSSNLSISWKGTARGTLDDAMALLRASGSGLTRQTMLQRLAARHTPVPATGMVTAIPCHRDQSCLRFGLTSPFRFKPNEPVTFIAFDDGRLRPVAYRDGDGWVLDDVETMNGEKTAKLYRVETISEPLLSFVHISDVQLREARAKLGTLKQSRGLDRIVDSFEHDFEQELLVDLVLQAVVHTVNKTTEEVSTCDASQGLRKPLECPRFAIHTGDAIDAGLRSEFDTFHRIMDGLEIPWLSAIGNHDVLAFGNFIPGDEGISTRALLLGAKHELEDSWYWELLESVTSARWTVKYQQDGEVTNDTLLARETVDSKFASGFIEPHRDHVLRRDKMELRECISKASKVCVTRDHGFDLASDEDARERGYYSVEFSIPHSLDGKPYILRMIVLNTSDYSDAKEDAGGLGGYLSEKQLDWLDAQLEELTDRHLVLVAGHHPMATIRNDGCRQKKRSRTRTAFGHFWSQSVNDGPGCNQRLLAKLDKIAKSRHLIGYITGHKHRHHIEMQNAEEGQHPFWEIETASIIGFPQEARWITIRRLDERVGFLELVPFGHGFELDEGTPFRRALARAQRGAKRDRCRKNRCVDGEPIRTDDQHGPVRLFFLFPGQP